MKLRLAEWVDAARRWVERTILWRVWERLAENEFLDRSIALSGKAFVSSFPLVIVVAALSTNTRNNPGRAGGPDHRYP